MKEILVHFHKHAIFYRRSQTIANHFSLILPSGNTLDVGCGDGTIDVLIMKRRPDVLITGVDVLPRVQTRVPVTVFDGGELPFDDNSLESVIFIDTLHHTEDLFVLLREAKRVSRRFIVIKDHVLQGFFARETLRLMDWVGNAPHGVALPYNYWTHEQWQSAFAELNLHVTERKVRLGLYPWPASLLFERSLHYIAVLAV